MSRALIAAAVLAAAVGCKDQPKVAPPAAPPPAAAPQGAGAFTTRDLALAYALDARTARLTLAASDLESRLAAADAKARAGAKALLPALDAARAEVERAAAAIQDPADRAALDRLSASAREYAGKLSAAAASGAAVPAELVPARDALAAALTAVRQARATRRIAAPEPDGPERELAEARRDMERAEAGFMSRTRVAPREEGHEFDPAAARMTGQMAIQRARRAIPLLAEALREPAARYAGAQEEVLDAVGRLQGAAEAERAGIARAYHAAKADALAALADYFAALAVR